MRSVDVVRGKDQREVSSTLFPLLPALLRDTHLRHSSTLSIHPHTMPLDPHRSSPALHWEIIEHILSCCDPCTLGRASLVSFATLERAGPLLYRHITITGFDQLGRMFYDQVSSSLIQTMNLCLTMTRSPLQHLTSLSPSPLLDEYLSLDQTKSFTFLGVPKDSQSLKLFRDLRTGDHVPPALHTFRATFAVSYWPSVTGSVLALFDPEHIFLSCLGSSLDSVVQVRLTDVRWVRIRSVTASGVELIMQPRRHPLNNGPPGRQLDLTFRLNNPRHFPSMEMWAYQVVAIFAVVPHESPYAWPEVNEIVVQAWTTVQKDGFESMVKRHLNSRLGPVKTLEKMAKIRYVVLD